MTAFRVRLASAHTPQQALLALRKDQRPFALIGSWAGGGALVGSEPVAVHEGDDLPPLGEFGGAGSFVGGGWIGVLGFPFAWGIERLPPSPPRPAPGYSCSLAYYDHLLHLDGDGAWWFDALADNNRVRSRLALLRERLAAPAPPARAFEISGVHVRRAGAYTAGALSRYRERRPSRAAPA